MNTYIINICVDTKSTDIYDKVAINKFPIIIQASNNTHLINLLDNESLRDYIRKNISQLLYENAAFYIRYISSDNGLCEENNLILKVKEYTHITYT